MVQEAWQQVVSPEKPCHFDSGLGVLELRACFSTGKNCTLRCTVAGRSFALAKGGEGPHHQVNLRLEEDAVLSCDSGSLIVQGILRPSTGEAPTKRARVEQAADQCNVESEMSQSVVASQTTKPAEKTVSSAAPKLPEHEVEPRVSVDPAKSVVVDQPSAPKVAVDQVAPRVSADRAKPVVVDQPSAPKVVVDQVAPVKKHDKAAKPLPPVARRRLVSGLEYEVLQAGKGAAALLGKSVSVIYEGRLTSNGQVFDSSRINFRLGMGEVIRGWDEGIKGMLQGEKRRLHVPARLGYGREGAPPNIPPQADLVFDVELL